MLSGVRAPVRIRLRAPRGALAVVLALLVAAGLLSMHSLAGAAPSHASGSISSTASVEHAPEDAAHTPMPCPTDDGDEGTPCLSAPAGPAAPTAVDPPLSAMPRLSPHTITADAVAHSAPRRTALSPQELSISRT